MVFENPVPVQALRFRKNMMAGGLAGYLFWQLSVKQYKSL